MGAGLVWCGFDRTGFRRYRQAVAAPAHGAVQPPASARRGCLLFATHAPPVGARRIINPLPVYHRVPRKLNRGSSANGGFVDCDTD